VRLVCQRGIPYGVELGWGNFIYVFLPG